jgi:hypothetical protein
MTNDLLTSARSLAERSSSPVRAAARMRIARVESAVDPGQARITFEIALDEIRSLPKRDRQALFEQAQQVAAALAPDLLGKIPSARHFPSNHRSETLLSIMLEHGHIDAAFDYVLDCDVPFGFPFGYAANLMHKLDQDRRLTVLRCAIKAWRAPQDSELMRKHRMPHEDARGSLIRLGHLQGHFIRLFQHQWKILPGEEALAVVREIVQIALDRPDLGTSAGYPDGIHLTSSREHALFEVLHILRHLDPPLAESLIASFSQLAAAAHRYPNGIETMHHEDERQAEQRRKQMAASGETCPGGFVMAGDPRDFSRQLALHRSSQVGDFGPSIDYAFELYQEDTNSDSPNQALKAFWPSTASLRNTLYNAGKNLGPNAATLLDRIRDLDLRLFAQIELAAALIGLPAFPETSMKQRRRPPMEGTPMRGPHGAVIRCPECGWVPVQEARWPCKCRHVWNTFDTRGLCPACKYQWEVTQCLSCGEVSAHAAWYPRE